MLEGAADNIIEVLPPEVIGEYIFSYLSPKEVVQSETVSKSWRCLARDPLLWHSFCRRQIRQKIWPPKVEALGSAEGWRFAFACFSSLSWDDTKQARGVVYSTDRREVWSSKPWQVVQTLTPLNEGTHVMRIQFFGESFGVGVAPLYAPTDKRPFSATGWGLFTSGWINARGRKEKRRSEVSMVGAVLVVRLDLSKGSLVFEWEGHPEVPKEGTYISGVKGVPLYFTATVCEHSRARILGYRQESAK